MTYFTYNGRSSAEFGLHIEKKDVFSAPEYDAEFISRTFVQKRQMPRQTEERKKHMSEVMKEKWRERHAKND